MTSKDVIKALNNVASKDRAKILMRFFKTGKGQYGEGDIFLGIVVPEQRKISNKFREMSLVEVKKLLESKFHECRMVALFILVQKYKNASLAEKKKIFQIYISNTKYINNWDLVDLSAPNIVGQHLVDKPRKILYEFANSKDLWKRRIAIISTAHFIRLYDFKDTLNISEILLSDRQDLIHKAVGWMLREVGKRDESVLKKFLDKYYVRIPRTTLRYAIERFPEKTRLSYLKKK